MALSGPAAAARGADYFKGKNVTWILGTAPGGGHTTSIASPTQQLLLLIRLQLDPSVLGSTLPGFIGGHWIR